MHLSCKVLPTLNYICCFISLSRSIPVSFCNILQSDLDFIILSNFMTSATVTSIFLPFPDHLQICWKARQQNMVPTDSKFPPQQEMILYSYFWFLYFLLFLKYFISSQGDFIPLTTVFAHGFVKNFTDIWIETTMQIREVLTGSFK